MDGGLQMADVWFMERNDFSCRRYCSSNVLNWICNYADWFWKDIEYVKECKHKLEQKQYEKV